MHLKICEEVVLAIYVTGREKTQQTRPGFEPEPLKFPRLIATKAYSKIKNPCTEQ